MAIYVDSKMMEPKEDGSSLQRKYYREREEVKKLFERFRVRGQDTATIVLTRDYYKEYNKDRTTWKPVPPISLPTVAHIYDEELGSVEVRYSATPPLKVGKQIVWQQDKSASMMFETMALTSDKLDLAWFMLKASGYLEKGYFKIIDQKKEYSKLFDEVILQRDVTNMIFDESNTTEQLARVAAEFFDAGTFDYESVSGKEELAMKLLTKAIADQKNIKDPGLVRLKKACQKAGLGVKNVPADKTMISFEYDGETYSTPLLEVPPSLKYPELQQEAVELGLIPYGKKKEVVYTQIEYVKELRKQMA